VDLTMIVMWEDDGSAIIFFSNDTIISSVDEIMVRKLHIHPTTIVLCRFHVANAL
jgi:hypothetical protein